MVNLNKSKYTDEGEIKGSPRPAMEGEERASISPRIYTVGGILSILLIKFHVPSESHKRYSLLE